MIINQFVQRQMELVFDLSESDFWLIYWRKTFNSLDNLLRRLDYYRNSKLEILTTDNTLVFVKYYFFPLSR